MKSCSAYGTNDLRLCDCGEIFNCPEAQRQCDVAFERVNQRLRDEGRDPEKVWANVAEQMEYNRKNPRPMTPEEEDRVNRWILYGDPEGTSGGLDQDYGAVVIPGGGCNDKGCSVVGEGEEG